MTEQAHVTFFILRKSLEGTVIHACPHCEAPGIYRSDEHTKQNWPGCWKANAWGQPVGSKCPNCGNMRRKDRDLGELSSSMPRWIWRCILGVKWCVIKLVTLKHAIGAQHG